MHRRETLSASGSRCGRCTAMRRCCSVVTCRVTATAMPAQAAVSHASNFSSARNSTRPAMQPFHSRPGRCQVHTAARLHVPAPHSKQQAMRSFQRSRPQSMPARPADRQAPRQPDASAGRWRSRQQEGQPPPQGPSLLQSVRGAAAAAGVAAVLAATPLAASPAWGADAAKVLLCAPPAFGLPGVTGAQSSCPAAAAAITFG